MSMTVRCFDFGIADCENRAGEDVTVDFDSDLGRKVEEANAVRSKPGDGEYIGLARAGSFTLRSKSLA